MNAQFYFGRNKVQYEEFNWHILKTDHFHIYYYTEEAEIAKLAAKILEDSYKDLEIKFNHTLWDTVPLIIYSSHTHFQQTNILPMMIPEGVGGFFEHRKGRVVIPYLGDLSAFRNVLIHELAHVFTFSKLKTPVRLKLVNNVPSIPHWFSEGLAEWWSVGWDTKAEMVIRDRLVNGTLVPLSNVSGYLSYKEGQAFLRWFEGEFGIQSIRKILDDYWIYSTFEECIEDITGIKFNDLFSQWLHSLRTITSADLSNDDIGIKANDMITSQGLNIYPVPYRNSKNEIHIVYLSSREGLPVIYKHPLYKIGDRKRLIATGKSTEMESVHFLESGMDVHKDDKLVISVRSNQHDVLQVINMNTGEILATYSHDDIVTIRSPKWSEDGKQITFSGQNFSGNSDIYNFNLETTKFVNLTNDVYTDRDPSFDFLGNNIVFSSDRTKNKYNDGLDLFIINIKSGQISLLHGDEFKKTSSFWSKKDQFKIYFLSDKSGMNNIWSLTKKNSDFGKFILSQETDFHTGISQFYPFGVDSAIVGVFKDFSYQIAALPLETVHEISWDQNKVSVDNSNWPPKLGIGKKTRELPYKLQYRLDFAQTSVAMDPIYGMLGGAQLSLSDQLGNRYYHFLVANSAQARSDITDRWNIAVTYLNMTNRTNWGLSIFRFANQYYSPYEGFYFEKTFGLRGAVNFPYSQFRRLEISSSMWYASKNNFFDKIENSVLISNFASFINDNTIWSPVGPRDGMRARLTLGPSFDLNKGRYHNFTIWFDLRKYWQIIPRVTIAQRAMLWMNDGKSIRRYYIGGSWGMRGYNFGNIRGRKIAMINQELRFPIANNLQLNFRTSSLWIAPIYGSLFIDIGNGWEKIFEGAHTSIGFGLRGALFGAFVIRLDAGIKSLKVNTIPNDKFFQIFFGWDF